MHRIVTTNQPLAIVLWLSTCLLLSACSDSQSTDGKSDSSRSDRRAGKATPPTAKKKIPSPRAATEKEAVAVLEKAKVELTFNDQGHVTAASFHNTKVTEEALAQLANLKMLEGLRLDGHDPGGPEDNMERKIDDKHLEYIQGLTQIKRLFLSVNYVSDKGLALLEGLTNLEILYLNKTEITASGLKHLVGLPRLRTLNLQDTSVRDEGLDHLKRMPSLKHIYLNGAYVSDQGVRALQAAMPKDVYISYQFQLDEPDGDGP